MTDGELDERFQMIDEGDVVEVEGDWYRVVDVDGEELVAWSPGTGLEEFNMPERVTGFADRRTDGDVTLRGREDQR